MDVHEIYAIIRKHTNGYFNFAIFMDIDYFMFIKLNDDIVIRFANGRAVLDTFTLPDNITDDARERIDKIVENINQYIQTGRI